MAELKQQMEDSQEIGNVLIIRKKIDSFEKMINIILYWPRNIPIWKTNTFASWKCARNKKRPLKRLASVCETLNWKRITSRRPIFGWRGTLNGREMKKSLIVAYAKRSLVWRVGSTIVALVETFFVPPVPTKRCPCRRQLNRWAGATQMTIMHN